MKNLSSCCNAEVELLKKSGVYWCTKCDHSCDLASPELTETNKDWEKEFDKEGFTESIDTDNEIKDFIRNLLSTKEKELFDKYIDALIWCSGSEDFQLSGKAREGWEKICLPLINKDK